MNSILPPLAGAASPDARQPLPPAVSPAEQPEDQASEPGQPRPGMVPGYRAYPDGTLHPGLVPEPPCRDRDPDDPPLKGWGDPDGIGVLLWGPTQRRPLWLAHVLITEETAAVVVGDGLSVFGWLRRDVLPAINLEGEIVVRGDPRRWLPPGLRPQRRRPTGT